MNLEEREGLLERYNRLVSWNAERESREEVVEPARVASDLDILRDDDINSGAIYAGDGIWL
jgi:hypothetical protein